MTTAQATSANDVKTQDPTPKLREPAGGFQPTPYDASLEVPSREGVSRTASAKELKATGTKMATSLGKTMIGMHPLYLMGEAITGKKVGSKFLKESKGLVEASEVLRQQLQVSGSDIFVIINEQLKAKGDETSKTADVLKKAGDHAIVVVSTHIEKAQDQMKSNSPALKKSLLKNGREAIIVLDKGLKHPMVITGVAKFARSRGIPRGEAILIVASFALSKILAALPPDEVEIVEGEGHVEEVDAEELERHSTKEAEKDAQDVKRKVEQGEKHNQSGKEKKEEKKKDGCLIM